MKVHSFSLLLFGLVLCCTSCVTSQPWGGKRLPEDLSRLTFDEKLQIYQSYEIMDWSLWGDPAFYLRSDGANEILAIYSLDSLKPIINDVYPALEQEIREIETYDRNGNWLLYSSLGFLALGGVGVVTETNELYFTGRNIGIFALFMALVFEQFEWQTKENLQFQYNEALKDRLYLDSTKFERSQASNHNAIRRLTHSRKIQGSMFDRGMIPVFFWSHSF